MSTENDLIKVEKEIEYLKGYQEGYSEAMKDAGIIIDKTYGGENE